MNGGRFLPNSGSAMRLSSWAKKDARGYPSASATSGTSIGSLRSAGQDSPSAAGIPLTAINITAIKTKTNIRNRFILRHYFDARNPGRETGNQENSLSRIAAL